MTTPAPKVTCDNCRGTGTIQARMKGGKLRTFTCPTCSGTGKVRGR